MKTKKNPTAATVELHNVSIPIHQRTDTKNGVTYTGYLFTYMKDGKRVHVRRATLAEAEAAARDTIRGMVAGRSSAFTVTPEEHAELATALSTLRKHPGVTLSLAVNQWHEATRALPPEASITEAARFYAAHLAKGELPGINVPELVEAWVRAKEGEGLSSYYLKDIGRKLNRFAASFRCPVASITAPDIAAWLSKKGMTGRNANNIRNSIVSLFSFARDRGFLPMETKTAAELVKRVKERPSKIGIYTPGEIAKILHAAPEQMRAAIALAAFAGLRSAEIFRLDWSEVQLARGHILVSPEKAKTAQRRIVPISTNLSEWLVPLAKEEGRVCPNYQHLDNLTRLFTSICEQAGVAPQRNGFRHSYASYRLAVTHSADKVALEMGNSPRKLFTNYRELVTEAEAAQWFAVAPAKRGKIVAMPKQAAA
jgi:integrase